MDLFLQADNAVVDKVKRFASSRDGQHLLSILNDESDEKLNHIIESAKEGHYEQVQAQLASILKNPDIRKILEQMERYE